MEEKEKRKRKNDEERSSLPRIIGFVFLFLALFVWIAPLTILSLIIMVLLLQLYHPFLLFVAAPILGLCLASLICIGIIYYLVKAFSQRSKRKRGE